jgi:hypothetical protein
MHTPRLYPFGHCLAGHPHIPGSVRNSVHLLQRAAVWRSSSAVCNFHAERYRSNLIYDCRRTGLAGKRCVSLASFLRSGVGYLVACPEALIFLIGLPACDNVGSCLRRHSSVVEHPICNRAVVGSSPTAGSIAPHFAMQDCRKRAYQNRLSAVRLLRCTLLLRGNVLDIT